VCCDGKAGVNCSEGCKHGSLNLGSNKDKRAFQDQSAHELDGVQRVIHPPERPRSAPKYCGIYAAVALKQRPLGVTVKLAVILSVTSHSQILNVDWDWSERTFQAEVHERPLDECV